MKKILMSVFVFVSFIGNAAAQNHQPVTFLLTTDTLEARLLDSTEFQVFADPTGEIAIDEIGYPGFAHRFRFPQEGFLEKNKTAKAFWISYAVKNTTDKEMNISIGIEADSVITFIRDSSAPGGYSFFQTGKQIAWSKKDGFKGADVLPVSIPAHETLQIFHRISNIGRTWNSIAVGVFSTEKLVNSEFINNEKEMMPVSSFGNIFFSGFFFLAALFNLLLFKVTKEKEYFLLAGFLFFLFIQMNPWFTIMLARENQSLSTKISEAGLLYIVFFFQFIRHFFITSERFKKWDKVLVATNVVLGVSILSGIIITGNKSIELARSVIFIAAIGVYFFTIVNLLRLPGKEKKLFAGAMLPFMVCFVSLLFIVTLYLLFTITGNTKLNAFFDWVGEWAYLVNNISIGWAVLFFSHILFRRYEEQKKAITQQELQKEQELNTIIATQKIELEKQVALRTSELEESLEKLTTMQSQLIHSEKMAALGQITSGIAHEIQNPLNFVTNFSEVNEELIEEIIEELENGGTSVVQELIKDVSENTRKINLHGKRADAIVKGMLQHSQTGLQVKELTDINRLCEEMLKLSYQAARTKDMMLKVKFITTYDPRAGEVNVFIKEMSRVLINIFNNAFYALSLKATTINAIPAAELIPEGVDEESLERTMDNFAYASTVSEPMGHPGVLISRPYWKVTNGTRFEPSLCVITRRNEDFLEIRIRDNGSGIAQKHLNKIFQPFFTTKPTGSGTGLGLSLAYEIVTHGHNGELLVESKEGEYSEFIIRLPV